MYGVQESIFWTKVSCGYAVCLLVPYVVVIVTIGGPILWFMWRYLPKSDNIPELFGLERAFGHHLNFGNCCVIDYAN